MLRIAAASTIRTPDIRSVSSNLLFRLPLRLQSTNSTIQRNINMTDRFDGIEKKFGIAAYASPHEGFAAVVKARYSDFVVHEGD